MQFNFDFYDLINDNSTEFIAEVPSEGYYNSAGDLVKGKPKRYTLRGAIIAHRESKIFRSEGTFTGQDRALYMLEPLENALRMAKIIHKGKVFSVGDMLENSEFTGVWAYTLKYVSAFKETSPDYDITDELEDLEDRLDGTLVKESEPEDSAELTDSLEALQKRLSGE